MTKHTPATPLPYSVGDIDRDTRGQFVRSEYRRGNIACTFGADAKDLAAYIVHACNSYPRLVENAKIFREWYAEHFSDFSAEVNAQLLCMDNDTEALLRSLGEL